MSKLSLWRALGPLLSHGKSPSDQFWIASPPKKWLFTQNGYFWAQSAQGAEHQDILEWSSGAHQTTATESQTTYNKYTRFLREKLCAGGLLLPAYMAWPWIFMVISHPNTGRGQPCLTSKIWSKHASLGHPGKG